jgi:hypothetical protein
VPAVGQDTKADGKYEKGIEAVMREETYRYPDIRSDA